MIWDAIEPSLPRREDVATAGWALAGAWAAGALMAGGWLLAACAAAATGDLAELGPMLDLPWRALAGIVLISALAGAAFGEAILAWTMRPPFWLCAILAVRRRKMVDADPAMVAYLAARIALEGTLAGRIEP